MPEALLPGPFMCVSLFQKIKPSPPKGVVVPTEDEQHLHRNLLAQTQARQDQSIRFREESALKTPACSRC